MSNPIPNDKNSNFCSFVLFYDYNKNIVRRTNVTNKRKSQPLEINNMDSTDELERKNYENELNNKINWNHVNSAKKDSLVNAKVKVDDVIKEKEEDEKTYTGEQDNVDDLQIFPFEN